MVKKILKAVGLLLALVVLGAGSFFLWAKSEVARLLSTTHEIHTIDFPVPFPLTEDEVARLRADKTATLASAKAATATEDKPDAEGEYTDQEEAPSPKSKLVNVLAGVDLGAIALTRAIARGEHLVNSRYVCVECHGKDFSGGVMIDDPAIGTLLGPNITSGKGGKTKGYTPRDWDGIVRHGIKPDGLPGAMPSEDFQLMSDQELSDIIAYIQSKAPVDNDVAPVSLGPVGTILIATGKLPLSVKKVQNHNAEHKKFPPQTAASADFGKHLAGVCTGCHRQDLDGGKIIAGDPSWIPASNLTSHPEGLKGWTEEQFTAVMRTGKRPDGTQVGLPMTLITPYTSQMTEVEAKALWIYIKSLPALPTGK